MFRSKFSWNINQIDFINLSKSGLNNNKLKKYGIF